MMIVSAPKGKTMTEAKMVFVRSGCLNTFHEAFCKQTVWFKSACFEGSFSLLMTRLVHVCFVVFLQAAAAAVLIKMAFESYFVLICMPIVSEPPSQRSSRGPSPVNEQSYDALEGQFSPG